MSNQQNILIITQWKFRDPLIQTYTLPYVKMIKEFGVFKHLTLIVFNGGAVSVNRYHHNGIEIIELPFDNITFSSILKIYRSISRYVKETGVTHIHAWCTTAGTLGVLLKLFNKRLHLVIDSYEPHAEAMVENGEWSKRGLKFSVLFYFEKLQAKLADKLIFASEGMEDYIRSKYHVILKNYFVKPACVDLEVFKSNEEMRFLMRKELGLNNKIVCVYAGKLGGIYLDGEVFDFLKECVAYWKDNFRFLLLSNISEEELNEKCRQHSVPPEFIHKYFVPHSEVVNYLNMADFGICPVKPVPSKKYCSPIKNGEYWAMGLPVVITDNISTDSETIEKEDIGYVLKFLNQNDYMNAVQKMHKLLEGDRFHLHHKIRSVAVSKRSYKQAEIVYQKLYNS